MVIISETELADEFETFSISIDNSEVLEKLQRLCQLYQLSAENIVEEWVAFCSTKKQNSKRIDIDTLEHLERERLAKKDVKTGSKAAASSQPSQAHMYNVNELEEIYEAEDDDDNPLLNVYCTPDNKVTAKKRQHTPEAASGKRPINIGRSPGAGLFKSPGSQGSPSANLTPSQRYAGRGNAGEVVCSFGDSDGISVKPDVRHYPTVSFYDQESCLRESFKFMFQKTSDKAIVLNDLIIEMGHKFKESRLIEEFAHVALPVQETVTVVGRICCDSNGKLNASSLLLEGAKDTSAGRHVALDVSSVPLYSLFPGQIVAIDGTNNSGRKLMASKIHEGIFLPSSRLPSNDVKFTMLIAAGPFTTSDNILYEPLNDLLAYVQKETPPDVFILLGPFVDVKHPLLEKGDIGTTYEGLFAKIIAPVIQLATRLKIQVVIAPSTRDLHHDFVYPQPPFSQFKDLNSQLVKFVSDPCTLDIDGISVGLTSTDILFHLGAEEISGYYPLYPPHPEVPIDMEQFDNYCRLPVTPNLFVLPSDLRCFVKDVGDTVCINPGRMAKGQVGGTFTRVTVDYKSSQATEGAKNVFARSVRAEIVRI